MEQSQADPMVHLVYVCLESISYVCHCTQTRL